LNPAANQNDSEKANEMKGADEYKEGLVTEAVLEQVARNDAEDGSADRASETHEA
jgi:hypothetical protein